MQTYIFLNNLRSGIRGLVCSAELGMRHGPRLGLEIGAAAGSILPIIGTGLGAVFGLILGGPLGVLVGIIGGAINRRWGWALGGALPGAVMAPLLKDQWLLVPAWIACLSGAIAGYRLGMALDKSTEVHFKRFQANRSSLLSATPLLIRLGLCLVVLWTLADFTYSLVQLLRTL